MRVLTRSRRAGFCAGLAFVLCFWHTQQVLVLGRIPLSVFYALLPWPFNFVERLQFARPHLSFVAGGGTILGLLTFTHPGYAFWAMVLVGLYGLSRAAFERSRLMFRGLVLMLIWSVALGAFLTVPRWIERAQKNG